MLAMDQSLEQQDSNKRPDGVQVPIIETDNKEKSHKCNQCEYATAHASALRAHLKTHSGEKPNKRKHYDDVTVMIMTVMLLQGHIFHGVGDDGSHKKERKLFF